MSLTRGLAGSVALVALLTACAAPVPVGPTRSPLSSAALTAATATLSSIPAPTPGIAATSTADPTTIADRIELLVIQPDDLTEIAPDATFERFDEGPIAMADVPPGPRADPVRWGRLGGWKSRFRSTDPEARSVLVVESRVDLFSDPSGAAADLAAYRDQFAAEAAEAGGAVDDVASIGEEAVTLTYDQTSMSGDIRYLQTVWRRGPFTALLLVSGYADAWDPSFVDAAMQLIDERLSGASGTR